jgi:hypothetical protein
MSKEIIEQLAKEHGLLSEIDGHLLHCPATPEKLEAFAKAYAQGQSIPASRLIDLANEWKRRVHAIGRDVGTYRQCYDELLALAAPQPESDGK